jgi:pilus assembly protein Flp/PilA
MQQRITAFLKDESGQTSTEYILLVAVVAFVIFKFKNVLNDKLVGEGGLVGKVFDNADNLLEGMDSQ